MIIQDEGIRLQAKLDLPETDAERNPTVILVHGITGHSEERHIKALAAGMNEIGFAVLRVDLYGHGRSGGEFAAHTLHKWVHNLLTVIDRVKQLDFVSDLYLCGHSQGGLAVMLAAAERPDIVRGLIPLSPAWTIPEGARTGCLLGQEFDPANVPDRFPLWDGYVLEGAYLRDAREIRVEEAMDRYPGPVLIVHGTGDATVPVTASALAAKRYKDCTLVEIPGDTHCYDRHPDRMVAAVQKWLQER